MAEKKHPEEARTKAERPTTGASATDARTKIPDMTGSNVRMREGASDDLEKAMLSSGVSHKRDEASSAVPQLPVVVDTEGKDFETPSWKPLFGMGFFIILMIFMGILVITHGYVWSGIGLFVVGGVFFFGMAFVGKKFAWSTLRAPHNELLTSEEKKALAGDDAAAADEARRVQALGGLLGRSQTGALKVFSGTLTPEQAKTIGENRAKESDATWAWLRKTAEPERIEITSEDGLTLIGHVIRCAPESGRWVLFAHGYNGTWNEMMLYARRYAEKGFNMLMPEMRGHGESGGDWVGMGWLERRDLVCWAKWLVEDNGADIEIVLHGHSMGGAAVCLASAEKDLPEQVKATVSDCAYTDACNVFAAVAKGGLGMPAHPLIECVRAYMLTQKGGYDLTKAAPLSAVPMSRVPIIFFHGERDNFVAPYMAGKLYEAAGGAAVGDGKRLETFPAGHAQSCLSDPDRYFGSLFEFVERCL